MGKCRDPNGNIDAFKKPKTSGKSRRASKGDRHSKVNTAQGPRDRRMRLSVEVSKKFFRLQDLLGFDKASKTVEWLLMKSQSCIQELMTPHGISISESSASKYDFWSEYIDGDQSAKGSSSSNRKGKTKTRKRVRTSSYLLRPCAKETREMARKRARERTLEKSSKQLAFVSGGDDQVSKFTPCLDLTMDQGVDCFGSWMINQPEITLQNKGVLQMTSSWNPSFLLNYQQTEVHPQEASP
ncbi:hypothetical protein M8C21_024204 [Ambrosia artemisiifolia]|uniref:Uncharacterized protein n=1 Tax=Ambrosia artemisiifolia TaxID=4212 RepID=A0AAD5C010_AMBAR|nr:hypothetical protein M8C21_024204 [Ambrosia artemisiifolia]